MRRSLCAPSP